MALLLLAHAAMPGRVEAATVDHGLRAESGAEAAMVARTCRDLGVQHRVLRVEVGSGNLQNEARQARYDALSRWMNDRGLAALLTAHHADDQAETLLMRLNRGSGLAGLAGVRPAGKTPGQDRLVLRPLLSWRKSELEELVRYCGLTAADDPSNTDERFDRARMRRALQQSDWIDPVALSRSAANLADAEEALAWSANREWRDCVTKSDDGFLYRPSAPRAVQLRVLGRAIRELGGDPRGSQLAMLVDALRDGKGGNVAGVLASSDKEGWRLRREPPRR